MKQYTNEQLNAFMSDNVVRVPVIKLIPPDDPNMIDGHENMQALVTSLTWHLLQSKNTSTFVYQDEGSLLATTDNSTFEFRGPKYSVESGKTYTISIMYKMVSGEEPPFKNCIIRWSGGHQLEYAYPLEAEKIDAGEGWFYLHSTLDVDDTFDTIRLIYRVGEQYGTYTCQFYMMEPQLAEGDSMYEEYTIPTTDIVAESIEINQILDGSRALSFGSMNSASMKFQCANLNENIRGYRVKYSIVANGYTFDMFQGFVDSQTNQNHEDVITTVTCYDYMYKLNQMDLSDWWKEYTAESGRALVGNIYYNLIKKIKKEFPIVIYHFTNGIDSYNYIEYQKMIDTFGYPTAYNLLKCLSTYFKAYLYFDGPILRNCVLKDMVEGLHPAIGLYPKSGLYPKEGDCNEKYVKSDYVNVTYEPYKTEPIDKVISIGSKKNVVASTDGGGNNPFYVDASYFTFTNENYKLKYVNEVKALTDNIYFTPSKIEAFYDPRIEIGDVMKVYTSKNIVYTYVLQKNIKGTQATFATYTSKSTQYQPKPGGLK